MYTNLFVIGFILQIIYYFYIAYFNHFIIIYRIYSCVCPVYAIYATLYIGNESNAKLTT